METVQTDQTAPDQGLQCFPFHYFKKQLHERQNLGQKSME